MLFDGDDENVPVAESVRAFLDGHLVLSRELAERAHWPAIDVLASISRSMTDLTDDSQQRAADELRAVLSARRDAEDLVSVGASRHGANRMVDAALEHESAINDFLRQQPTEMNPLDETLETMTRLVADLGAADPDEGRWRAAA